MRRHLLFWAACLLICLTLLSGWHIYETKTAEAMHGPSQSLGELERLLAFKIEAILKTKKELDSLREKQASLQGLIGRSDNSQIIFRLAGVMEGNIWLENLSIKREEDATRVGLSGFSLENEDLGNLLNKLSWDPLFSELQLKYARGERMNVGREENKSQMEVIHFRIDSLIPWDKRP
jgi:hypothetical protein